MHKRLTIIFVVYIIYDTFCESCKGMKDERNTAEGPALPGMCSGQKLCAQSLPVSDARGARKTTVYNGDHNLYGTSFFTI